MYAYCFIPQRLSGKGTHACADGVKLTDTDPKRVGNSGESRKGAEGADLSGKRTE